MENAKVATLYDLLRALEMEGALTFTDYGDHFTVYFDKEVGIDGKCLPNARAVELYDQECSRSVADVYLATCALTVDVHFHDSVYHP